MKLYLKRFILPEMGNKPSYPYRLLASKQMKELVFELITILYGSNGPGKSTLLNIIARKLNIGMNDKGNVAESLQPFIDSCKYEVTALFNEHCDIPEESCFIRSEDVMHGIVKVRQHNERVKEHIRNANPELYDRFFNNLEGTPDTYGVTTAGYTTHLKNMRRHAVMENWHLIISKAISQKTHW